MRDKNFPKQLVDLQLNKRPLIWKYENWKSNFRYSRSKIDYKYRHLENDINNEELINL